MPEIHVLQPGDLQGIPSLFGRLSFVAASRDLTTGLYQLPAPRTTSAEDEIHLDLARLHKSLFIEWLSLSLERRATDIKVYLEGSDQVHPRLFRILSDPESGHLLLPNRATPAEESLFSSDLRLLGLLLNTPTRAPLPNDRCQHTEGQHDWRITAAIASAERQDNYIHPTLKMLSHDLRVSARHLGRLFRKNTGVAFHQYLRAIRLVKASDLLRALSSSVKEVSSAVGYTSTSNFSREFTSATGMSPTRYREHLMAITAHRETDATGN